MVTSRDADPPPPTAAGKDSTTKHVMTGLNPQGVRVVSFKQPSSEEVFALRVYPESLARQMLPEGDRGPGFWQERYDDAISATSKPWAPWYVLPADDTMIMQALAEEE